MFPPTKPGYRALTGEPNQEDREALYSKLRVYGKFTGLCWLLRPEPELQRDLPVPTVDALIFSEEVLQLSSATEQLELIRRKLKIKKQIVMQVGTVPIGQRKNPSWHLVRKGCLTASKFGAVINAKRVTPSLLKCLLGEYDISCVKDMAWAITNETEAIKAFTAATNHEVVATGVWLDESGVLEAFPDGLEG